MALRQACEEGVVAEVAEEVAEEVAARGVRAGAVLAGLLGSALAGSEDSVLAGRFRGKCSRALEALAVASTSFASSLACPGPRCSAGGAGWIVEPMRRGHTPGDTSGASSLCVAEGPSLRTSCGWARACR